LLQIIFGVPGTNVDPLISVVKDSSGRRNAQVSVLILLTL